MSQLESRLNQLYDDLASFENREVGHQVAELYNDLFNQTMKDRTRACGLSRVDHETDGRTVRLLVGQLRLIASG
jgi:hypothetical protein